MTVILEGRSDSAVRLDELPTGTPVGIYFARALLQGAGREALLRLARNYLDFDSQGEPVGLPYVGVLIRAGWSTEDVRSFLEALCFEYDTSHLHRRAFWIDDTAWRVIGTHDGLFRFVSNMATEDPSAVLSARAHNSMQQRFAESVDDSAALVIISNLQMLAMRYLKSISSPYQLNVALLCIKKLEPHDAIKVAGRIAPNSYGLVLYGMILAKFSEGVDVLIEQIAGLLNARPELAVQIYRLLAEGAGQFNRDYGHVLLRESRAHALFTQRGWHFARVETREDGLQQVIVKRPNVGAIVLRHTGEPLSANTEVMVHEEQLKGVPSTMVPGMKIYCMPLSPTVASVELSTCESFSSQKSV